MLLGMLPAVAERIPWTTSRIIGSPEPPLACRVERAFPNLNFNEPAGFVYEPVTKRWFVGQIGGQLLSFPDRDDVSRADEVGNLRSRHPKLGQFLDFTFHPGFATNRFVFAALFESAGATNSWVLARYRLTAEEPPQLDLASEAIILTTYAGGHDGACIRFGPDGMLYASIGDTTSPEPPDARKTGQDISDLQSSILRIDVDHADAGMAYRIPADNPFVNRPGARGEVWAYGFRNPWRMGFGDNGVLWVADVGWELWETVHRVTAGYNGGWAVVEGPNPAVRNDVKVGPTPIAKPAASHAHSEASSITGGVAYRGKSMARLAGQFIYGDWETGKIWALADRPDAMPEELVDTSQRIVAFANDRNGEVLFADYSSNCGLYRLVPNSDAGKPSNFPRRLSETGLFADTAKQQPAPGVEPYKVTVPRWADGALGERWIAIPGNGVQRDKQFPRDSVLAKTYSLELEAGNPASRRRLETQLLHFNGEAWAAYSYRWNEAQTDAELVPKDGANATLSVKDAGAPGGNRELNWRFFSRSECLRCHNPWSGNALAFNPEQLLHRSGDATEFHRLAQRGIVAPADTAERAHLAALDDSAAPLEARARSWLHANCAHCHRFGAGGSVASFFNFDTKLADARLLNYPPARGTFGLTDASVITPGLPERSTLWFRLNTEGQGHMPHLGSRTTDEAASRQLAAWIESLAPDARRAAPEFNSTTGALAALRAAQQDAAKLPGYLAQARKSTNAFVRDLFERFLPAAERRHVLGADFNPTLVLALKGDARRGGELFHGESGPQCARCHVVAGRGRNYGPELTGLVRKFPRAADVLDHIVNPAKQVAPEFQLHLVETRDGESLSGFVQGKAGGGLQLRIESGELKSLKGSAIASDVPVAGSAMPEGLLANLTAQEAADLLAYLLKPTP
jgi:putative heme-binding domain-containing protein